MCGFERASSGMVRPMACSEGERDRRMPGGAGNSRGDRDYLIKNV